MAQQLYPVVTHAIQEWQDICAKELWEYHDDPLAGHPGCDETLREIQIRFYWPGMRRSFRRYLSSCHLCTCCKPVCTTTKDTIWPRAAQRPWEKIALDLVGPYPLSSTGKRFLLVVTDLFSRWIEASVGTATYGQRQILSPSSES